MVARRLNTQPTVGGMLASARCALAFVQGLCQIVRRAYLMPVTAVIQNRDIAFIEGRRH